MSKKNNNKDNSIRSSIISMPDPLFDIGLFKEPKIAKHVLAKVAADVFSDFGNTTEAMKKFDEFISGRVEPLFDPGASKWGVLPSIKDGKSFWIVPVDRKLTNEEEKERSKDLSKEILTIGPDTTIRSLTRFFLLSSEEKRTEYVMEAEKELIAE